MKLTTTTIGAFIRRGVSQGCRQFAWSEEDWRTLQNMAIELGWPPPEKSGDTYCDVRHYLIEDNWL